MYRLPCLGARAAFALAWALSSAAALPAHAAPAAPPAEQFFANPKLEQVRLSPKGGHLAAISAAPGRRDVLAVIDLQARTIKIVAGYAGFDILQFEWVNEDRLLYTVGDRLAGPGNTYQASGLFAVNRDGGAGRQLAARHADEEMVVGGGRLQEKLLPWHTFMLGQRGAEDSDWVYVESHDYDPSTWELRQVELLRLNTVSGLTRIVPRPGPVKRWLLDNAGEPRLAVASAGETLTLHYREPASGQWRVLATQARFASLQDSLLPVGFDGAGALYAEANAGKDTSALYQVDLASGKLRGEPLVVAHGYDFDGRLVARRGKLLGAHLRTDAVSSVWFDPAMAALQQKIDKLLPGMINLLDVPTNADPTWVLVTSYSDRHPPTYLLYDVRTGELDRVGESYAGIDPARMGRQQAVRFKARDGREIPALLTLPPGGGKNLPLVVLVHGGPFVRGGSWGWNPESQFLATRGYAVLEPEFRGSLGFGEDHHRAGWKQWGLAMQDDLADGARWAVAQGHADPQRICIAGASYGGYAALMGLVKDGDLYRCGVSWAGVSDIALLYGGGWRYISDLGEDWKTYGMPQLVGDPVRDAAQLQATSPVAQAARIKRPLLLAHGGMDRRVPIAHGKQMHAAVAAHNRQVEWVEYPEEGHGWSLPKNRIDFWSRVERFLDRHIGPGGAR